VTLWVLLRAAGIGAYVALFLSVVWGLVSTTGVITKRVTRPAGNHFHAVVAATGLVLLTLHMVLLVMHDYFPFGVLDVLVPLRGPYRVVATGLGIVAMYAMIVVTVSSWVRKFLPTRLWRDIHLLAIPAFILALLHGVFSGTDTDRPAMVALYVGSGLLVLFLVLVRGLTVGFRPPRPSASDRTPKVEAPHGSAVAS
jgi:cytochrome b561